MLAAHASASALHMLGLGSEWRRVASREEADDMAGCCGGKHVVVRGGPHLELLVGNGGCQGQQLFAVGGADEGVLCTVHEEEVCDADVVDHVLCWEAGREDGAHRGEVAGNVAQRGERALQHNSAWGPVVLVQVLARLHCDAGTNASTNEDELVVVEAKVVDGVVNGLLGHAAARAL